MYQVRTAVFEGPLDLLLQLINRHQLDVAAVNLTDLVTEYLTYLEEMSRLDLEVTSEFLLIAATLIQMKAHRLLPTSDEVDLDEELALMEERDRLLLRLLTCVTFKDVAAVFLRRMQETGRLVPRTAGMDQSIPVSPPDPVLNLDAGGLARLAARLFVSQGGEPDLDHLDLDLPSVQAAMDELKARTMELVECTFEDLTNHCARPVEVAAYFLALLELARWGLVSVSQEEWNLPIEVRHRPATQPARWSS
jgi:segregation and condensation protein A